METKAMNRIPVLGIILVVVGIGLLLKQMHVLSVDGATVLIAGVTVYGGVMTVRAFLSGVRQGLFFGGLCFYGGVLLGMGHWGIIESSPYTYVPGFLTVFGLAFLMLFVHNVRDFHLLVPAAVFIGLGAAFMLTEAGYWYVSDVKDVIAMYWPAALIVFGGLLLLRRRTD